MGRARPSLSRPALHLHPQPRLLAARLPGRELLAPLDPAQGVAAGLAQQLLEIAQAVGVDAGAHGAARLAAMRAVAKPALRRKRLHVFEARLQRRLVGIGTERAQARRVDDAGAARQEMERTRRRGVHAAAVVRAHRAGVLHRGADQGVGEGRLAGTGRAEQHQRATAASEMCANDAAAAGVGRVDDDRLDLRRDASAHALDPRVAQLRIGGGDVGFRQHHRRRDPACAGEREIALEAAQVEVVVEAHDQQGVVDVADQRVPAAVAVAP